ncbi:MAG: hypothetical protein WC350_04855 [Candidatus Micrarchaeia archaeon]
MANRAQSSIFIHQEEVKSIFQLLGTDENDLSFSLAYVIAKSPKLLKAIIEHVYQKKIRFNNVVIKLQEAGKDSGFTDVEIVINNQFFFLIEAKKGWNLPSTDQLKKYISRFGGFKNPRRMFIVLSDCSEEYVKQQFRDSLYGIPIKSLAWRDIIKLIEKIYAEVPHMEKHLFNELKTYLTEVVVMENKESNWVYVVSLRDDTPSWSKIAWKDIVYKKGKYFYPQGKNWPKIPPNYIAFRYDGKLQSIHHVERYEAVADVNEFISEIKKGKIKNHYLLWLGESFQPRKEVPNGVIWSNGRLWCMIDTLFTSSTLKEATRISSKRVKE